MLLNKNVHAAKPTKSGNYWQRPYPSNLSGLGTCSLDALKYRIPAKRAEKNKVRFRSLISVASYALKLRLLGSDFWLSSQSLCPKIKGLCALWRACKKGMYRGFF